MVGDGVHHLAVGFAEPEIVLEEVGVPEDVRHDEFLVDLGVGFLEIGVARVVVDDHLVDATEAVGVALGHLVVLGAPPPMGVADGEPAVGGDLVHGVEVEDLEDDLVEVEAVLDRLGPDVEHVLNEIGRQIGRNAR